MIKRIEFADIFFLNVCIISVVRLLVFSCISGELFD